MTGNKFLTWISSNIFNRVFELPLLRKAHKRQKRNSQKIMKLGSWILVINLGRYWAKIRYNKSALSGPEVLKRTAC
jgi:hypothetical protein